jgi:putative flavoprotein involved in K+ transport
MLRGSPRTGPATPFLIGRIRRIAVSAVMTTRSARADVRAEAVAVERHSVVVIGGGQAGLAAGYWLAQHGVDFIILDAHPRVGDAWRWRWDSLTLFTPAKISGLPGMPFPGSPHHFPTKDEVADYFEAYAQAIHLPVRNGIRATRVSRSTDDRWHVLTDHGTFIAEGVIIAIGGYERSKIPAFAPELDPSITQLHSSAYQRPSQLREGMVLVVGAGHSGADICVETARTHPTMLVGRDTGQIPVQPGGRLDRVVTPVIWFAMNHVLTVNTPMGRKTKRDFLKHGLPLERPNRDDIAAAGVERITERMTGVRDGRPVLADGRMIDAQNVVWCTGFEPNFGWIEGLPCGPDGYPEHDRGIAPGSPGIAFVGLRFQRSAASSLIGGVGRDARHVVDHLANAVRGRR